MLGFANKVHYVDGNRHGVVYLHPKDFAEWKNRHISDPEVRKLLTQASSQEKIEETIQTICTHFAARKENVSSLTKWDLPLTYDQVLEEAKKQFSDNPFSEEILSSIKEHLNIYEKNGEVILDGRWFSEIEKAKITHNVNLFFERNDLFPNLPRTYLK